MLLSTALDALYEKVQELGKQKFWFLYLVSIFIIVTIINGLSIVPEEPYQRLSQNPFITRTDIHFRNNFQETLLLPLAAYILGFTSRLTFNVLCYAVIAGGYAAFALYTYKRWGTVQALIFTTLLITSPLSTVLFSWLGMPDSLSIALVIPLLFTQSTFLVLILALLGSMNHITFLIAASEIIVLKWLTHEGTKFRLVLTLAAGAIAGVLLVKAFLAVNQIEVAPRAGFILTRSLWEWTKLNITHLPIFLFSLFNVQWLAVIVSFFMFSKWDKKFYLSVIAFFAVNYGIAFFSLDTTRIFSILSTGILMLCVFRSYDLSVSHPSSTSDYQKQYLLALLVIGTISLISPRYFAWAGEIHATPFYEFIRILLR